MMSERTTNVDNKMSDIEYNITTARKVTEQTRALLKDRVKLNHQADVLRSAINHWGAQDKFTRRLKVVQKNIEATQEQIDFNMAFAASLVGDA